MSARLVTIVGLGGVAVAVCAAAYEAHVLALRWRLGETGEDRLIGLGMTVAALTGAAVLAAIGRRLPWRPTAGPATTGVGPSPFEAERRARVAALRTFLASDPRLAKYVPLLDAGHVFDRAEIERREARVRELEGAHVRREYVDRVVRGERVTDETIAYWDDPTRTVCCEHLRACEADLRRIDPNVAPNGRGVTCRSRLDFAALRIRYAFPACVTFREEEQLPARSGEYYQGVQRIGCTCPSWIEGSAFGAPFPSST